MIEIVTAGPQTTVQDQGRAGFRGHGIAASGAADRLSYALANYCVGNPWSVPALECPLGGLSLRVHAPTQIAVTGATTQITVNDSPIESHRAYEVKRGDTLSLAAFNRGANTYVAFGGGIDVAPVMGSASTYLPAKFGGHLGRALKAGDRLNCVTTDEPRAPQTLPIGYKPIIENTVILRVCHGPEFDYLSQKSRHALLRKPFTASRATDRMGSRLNGPKDMPPLRLSNTQSLISTALLPGTLQVPPDGTPILLLADGHCTGGYVRALHVIRADLWQLGQIRAGTQIRFQYVDRDEALDALKKRTVFYADLIPNFQF